MTATPIQVGDVLRWGNEESYAENVPAWREHFGDLFLVIEAGSPSIYQTVRPLSESHLKVFRTDKPWRLYGLVKDEFLSAVRQRGQRRELSSE